MQDWTGGTHQIRHRKLCLHIIKLVLKLELLIIHSRIHTPEGTVELNDYLIQQCNFPECMERLTQITHE